MRVFLAGATGVIGSRLVPLLADAGHEVTGMTRSPEKAQRLTKAGAKPVVCNIFDTEALHEAVGRSRADLVIHQVTDLPDDITQLGDFSSSHNRIRREGTENLVTASAAAGVGRLLAQSVAWQLPGDSGAAVSDLEEMVLAYPGVVIRYGQFYGPGTFHSEERPPAPRIQIDEAAKRTVATLEADPGIVTIVES